MVPLIILYPLGAGTREFERLRDTLSALAVYGHGLKTLIILSDTPDSADAEQALAAARPKCPFPIELWRSAALDTNLPFPARITYATGRAYAEIFRRHPGCAVLKMDSDALVIAPFVERLSQVVTAHPEAGLFGSVNLSSNGTVSASNSWRPLILAMSRPLARIRGRPWREALWIGLWGARAQLRRWIKTSLATGHMPGDHAQGGLMVLSPAGVKALAELREMCDVDFAREYWITDDVLVGHILVAMGLKLHPLNAPGDVIGACWRGFPGYHPHGALARGHALIHSVKDHDKITEAGTRAFFQKHRAALTPTPIPT
jgi:hypothetical protein